MSYWHRIDDIVRPNHSHDKVKPVHNLCGLKKESPDDCFADAGFQKMIRSPQFFWPMAIHRKMNMPKVSSLLEGIARVVRLSTLFGSPVIATYRRVKR